MHSDDPLIVLASGPLLVRPCLSRWRSLTPRVFLISERLARSTGPVPASGDKDEGRQAVSNLRTLTDDQLVAAIQRSEEIRRAGRERTGRLLAELHRRGRLSWPAISRMTGIRQTTAYELAQPFIVADDGQERPS